MSPEEISAQLEKIAGDPNFSFASDQLVQSWLFGGIGVEAVEPILRFMENHADVDFGAPGPLVHFMERFSGPDYEDKVLESIQRRPTSHTVWMVNRIVNATKSSEERLRYLSALRAATSMTAHPGTSSTSPT